LAAHVDTPCGLAICPTRGSRQQQIEALEIMADTLIGFIGLGNMGAGMARNIAAKGHAMIVHDVAGTTDRAPQGATIAQSNGEVARRASLLVLSLPTVAANRAVVLEIAEVGNSDSVVVDTCTIGRQAAAENARILGGSGDRLCRQPRVRPESKSGRGHARQHYGMFR
jgi:hypothetical protein